ncbi:Uncharacterised protein [uncultured archaeon]|nr:Uncharacterised protein [uncultured archaeon]
MTKSGTTVHKEIKAKIKQAEKEAEGIEREIYGYESQINSLTEERENCYVTLATTYLPGLDAESVKKTLSEFQNTVRGIFNNKQKRRQQLEDLMKESKEKRSTLDTELEAVSEDLIKKTAERDSIRKSISEEIGKNDSYVKLDSLAKESNAKLDQNKKRVEEVEKEASEKLPIYENNKLFSYLSERKFGTPEYNETQGNMIKMLDSWVARIVGYKNAQKCYDFLRSMPELMRSKVEERQTELEGIVKQMKEIENEAGEKYGFPKVLEEGSKINNKKEKIIGQINESDKEYAEYSNERKEIDSKKDPYHNDAIQKLKAYLKGEKIADLKRQARETPGTEDDKLVSRIEEIDATVRGLKDKAKEAQTNREAYSEKLNGLKSIERKFKSEDFDSDRSYFPSTFDIGDFLTGYMIGKYSSNQVWGTLESKHEEEPAPVYHSSSSYDYGGSSNSSSNWSSPSTDSWSSGGGMGGGGWSSGSGF